MFLQKQNFFKLLLFSFLLIIPFNLLAKTEVSFTPQVAFDGVPSGIIGDKFIGDYINAFYNYGFRMAGIVAMIVFILAGLIWTLGGIMPGQVKTAQAMIRGAFGGLLLAMTGWMILNFINPDLLKISPIKPKIVEKIEGDTNASMNISYKNNAQSVMLLDTGTVKNVVKSAIGKVTYGLSNKPGDCNGKGGVGPNGTICFDCSGFAKYVIKSALNKTIPDGTANIFQNKPLIKVDLDNVSEGTLVGWVAGEKGHEYGHVLISLGNGQFADSHGGNAGRIPGNAIGIYSASKMKEKFGDKLRVYTP